MFFTARKYLCFLNFPTYFLILVRSIFKKPTDTKNIRLSRVDISSISQNNTSATNENYYGKMLTNKKKMNVENQKLFYCFKHYLSEERLLLLLF